VADCEPADILKIFNTLASQLFGKFKHKKTGNSNYSQFTKRALRYLARKALNLFYAFV